MFSWGRGVWGRSHTLRGCLCSQNQCKLIHANIAELLAIAWHGRDPDGSRQGLLLSIWEDFSFAYLQICSVDQGARDTWEQSAREVKAAAETYADNWVRVFPAVEFGLYMHILLRHIPDQIKRHGIFPSSSFRVPCFGCLTRSVCAR